MTRYIELVTEPRPVDVSEADLLTLTEAARQLGLSITTITGLLQRGKLRRIVDTTEPNPKRAGRVLKVDVEAELERRKQSPDSRLKQARKGKKR